MYPKKKVEQFKPQVLKALKKLTNYSKSAKIPQKYLMQSVRGDLRGFFLEAIRQLRKEGYIQILKRQEE